ncbi:MAG: hypothetical protein EPO39_06010 [Candidatus Manganitrophaceae bacterium]|nr:MAG: hypothetical protein EPO39_06010 [Candidatus Manganitrophaceae bacterium]
MGRDILLVNNEPLIFDLLSGSGYRVDLISDAMAALAKWTMRDMTHILYADAGVGRKNLVRENQRAISGLGSPDYLRDGGVWRTQPLRMSLCLIEQVVGSLLFNHPLIEIPCQNPLGFHTEEMSERSSRNDRLRQVSLLHRLSLVHPGTLDRFQTHFLDLLA